MLFHLCLDICALAYMGLDFRLSLYLEVRKWAEPDQAVLHGFVIFFISFLTHNLVSSFSRATFFLQAV